MATYTESGIDGTYLFDHNRSQQGYTLNKMCMSLTRPENREEFAADRLAYMRKFNLTDDQIAAIEAKDWLALTKMGGNVYMLLKLGHLVGDGLYALGAQQRGQTLDEFLGTRLEREAR